MNQYPKDESRSMTSGKHHCNQDWLSGLELEPEKIQHLTPSCSSVIINITPLWKKITGSKHSGKLYKGKVEAMLTLKMHSAFSPENMEGSHWEPPFTLVLTIERKTFDFRLHAKTHLWFSNSINPNRTHGSSKYVYFPTHVRQFEMTLKLSFQTGI